MGLQWFELGQCRLEPRLHWVDEETARFYSDLEILIGRFRLLLANDEPAAFPARFGKESCAYVLASWQMGLKPVLDLGEELPLPELPDDDVGEPVNGPFDLENLSLTFRSQDREQVWNGLELQTFVHVLETTIGAYAGLRPCYGVGAADCDLVWIARVLRPLCVGARFGELMGDLQQAVTSLQGPAMFFFTSIAVQALEPEQLVGFCGPDRLICTQAEFSPEQEAVIFRKQDRPPLYLPPSWSFGEDLGFGKTRTPEILEQLIDAERRVLRCRVPVNLFHFQGHFHGRPVLPGITMVLWAVALMQQSPNLGAFRGLHALKFHQPVFPGAELEITLNPDRAKGRALFKISSSEKTHVSGRILFQSRPG